MKSVILVLKLACSFHFGSEHWFLQGHQAEMVNFSMNWIKHFQGCYGQYYPHPHPPPPPQTRRSLIIQHYVQCMYIHVFSYRCQAITCPYFDVQSQVQIQTCEMLAISRCFRGRLYTLHSLYTVRRLQISHGVLYQTFSRFSN